jgi:hypothetical protein
MPIATVSVVVPSSGDGPAASVAALVGAKTVRLSGRFDGEYVLLGSHDGVTYVPLLSFDADGVESIKQTPAESIALVKVRAATGTVPLVPVTVTVSGVVGTGENKFAPIATFTPGAGGQVVVDTYLLFPLTGVEVEVDIICRGNFDQVLVEGSSDFLTWNPVGSFRGSANTSSLLNLSTVYEFSPLQTPDKVRYLRVTATEVSSTTTVTLGGRVPASGGTIVATDVAITSDSVTNLGYLALAEQKAVLSDAMGNTLTGAPLGDVVIWGQRNSVVSAGGPAAVYGSGNSVRADHNYVYGEACSVVQPGSANNALVGRLLTVGISSGVVLAGHGSSVGDHSDGSVVLGQGVSVGNISNGCFVAGQGATTYVGSRSTDSVAVVNSHVTNDSPASVAVGGSIIDHDSAACLALRGSTISFSSGSSAAINGSIIQDHAPSNLALHLANVYAGSRNCVAIFGTVGTSSVDAVTIGRGSVVGNSTSGTSVGAGAMCVGVSPNNWCMALGAGALAADSQCIVGHSDVSAVPNPSIRYFAVRGIVGPVGGGGTTTIDTLVAISEPVSGDTGLTVAYNNGASTTNKIVRAAVTPAVGSLRAYVDP